MLFASLRKNPRHNPFRLDYVLPNYSIGRLGYIKVSSSPPFFFLIFK
jgi:hypothetical protein